MISFRALDVDLVNDIASLATAEDLQHLGEATAALGLETPAELLFQKAVDAGCTAALVDLAVLARTQGHLEDAEAQASRAIEAGEASAYITRGNIMADLGRAAEARDDYLRAVAEGYVEGFLNLACLALEEGAEAEAEALFRDAIERGDRQGLRNLGVYLMDRGRHEEALDLLVRAASDQFEAWFDLGNCHSKMANHAAAREAYACGAALGDGRCHLALADLLADELGEPALAEGQYRAAVRGGDELAYFNFALFLDREDRADEAALYFGIAALLGQPEAWHELAKQSWLTGDLDRTRQLLTQAVALGDEDAREDLSQLLA